MIMETVKYYVVLSDKDKMKIRKNATKLAEILGTFDLAEGFHNFSRTEYYKLSKISPVFNELYICSSVAALEKTEKEIEEFLATI